MLSLTIKPISTPSNPLPHCDVGSSSAWMERHPSLPPAFAAPHFAALWRGLVFMGALALTSLSLSSAERRDEATVPTVKHAAPGL